MARKTNHTIVFTLLGLSAAIIVAGGLHFAGGALTAKSTQTAYEPVRISAEGTPAEIGEAIGKRDAAVIRQLTAGFIGMWQMRHRISREAVLAQAMKFDKHLADTDREELKGVAKGAGVSYAEVLFLNVFYSMSETKPAACRQVVAWGEATKDGKLIHARNLDWFDYPGDPLRRHNRIVNIKPSDKKHHEYLMLTWPALQGVLTGVNKAGLTVGFNTLPRGTKHREGLAEPTFFTLKRVLRECTTIKQAVALIEKAKPLDNGSIVISSDKEGKAVVVEIVEGDVGVREASDSIIGNANHATRNSGVRNARYYGDADAPAAAVARAIDGKLDVPAMQKVLADRRVMARNNLVSVVFAPSQNKLWLACGTFEAAAANKREMVMFHAE